jgi:hypothetical protein
VRQKWKNKMLGIGYEVHVEWHAGAIKFEMKA